MPRRHAVLALVVAVCWAVNFVVIDIGLESFPPLLFAALRFELIAFPAVLTYFAESQLHEMFKGMERQSSEFVKIEAGPAPTRKNRPPLAEPDDMKRVDFACHPTEPVKVREDWKDPVHCLVCGRATD
ncbi:MAG: EamA family transporter [Gaiellaceae bacterium]